MGMTAGRGGVLRVVRVMIPVMALLGLLHTALWFWAMAVLHDGIRAILTSPAAPGWSVAAGLPTRNGWPQRVALQVPDLAVTFASPDLPGGLAWSADALAVSVSLLRPFTLVLDIIGRQTWRVGAAPAIPVVAQQMRAEVPLHPGVPVRAVTVEVAGLRAELPEGGFALARLDLHGVLKPAAPQGEAAVALSMTVDSVGLPPGGAWPLGPRIDRIAVDASLGGPLPRGPHLLERAEAWRDGGGVLEVRRLDLHWGALRLAGSATVALDGQLQPMGAATARVVGHAETLDALVSARLLAARGAQAAKAVLALMAQPAADGGAPMVEVPFSLQNRTLALGRIPLVRVPELVWPQPQ